jgi:polysaccharide biosynthesis protein PslA
MSFSASFTREGVVSLFQERKVSRAPAARFGRVRYVYPRASARDPSRSVAKRVFDIAGAGSALLFLAPLLLGVAAAIKLTSRGPVLFGQYRYGYRSHRFRIYKFRTMYVDQTDRSGTRQTTRDDPRVTRLGRILRRTSLDELPQLFNVLKGDMSLVGPRPHVPGMLAASYLYEDLVPYYFHRHAVLPGITGLAQISGCRGDTIESKSAMDRIDYDLEYIETWSIWLDARIVIRTVRQEFLSGSGI